MGDLLFKHTKNGNCIVVPAASVNYLIEDCHDKAGHIGVNKTEDILSRKCFWKNMQNYISTYVKKCFAC